MKALVTGATGFIGSFLVEALCRKGYEVTCLVRKTSNLKWLRHLRLQYLPADLGETNSYEGKLAEFEYIFHLAGLTKADSARDFYHANAECTQIFIAAAARTNPALKRFLHVSSLAAAGPSNDGRPLIEDAPASPVSVYGKSKLEGEQAVLSNKGMLPVTIVRPPAVYGPRDTDFFLVFKAVQNRLFPYWGDSSYSLIYVEDLVQGMILAAETEAAAGKVYYLADKRIYTNDDILETMSSILGRKAFRLRLPRSILPALAALLQKIQKKGIINPDKIQEIRYPHWTCDPARAMKELGFHTKTPLGEGFKKTADWYRKEKWL
ncbi:MAG: NAD-dependent epimerase/dehydratase family protein [Nitrospirae bacterium]|nr:NAD-dependent epimerase/dehydratase family protein [Nitrospirota bacterium]